jgi:TPR repeat protein
MSILSTYRSFMGKFCHRRALSLNGREHAEKWFQKAAEYGHLQSQYDLATMKGIATSWETLLEIADGGYLQAQNLCAIALIVGDLKSRPCGIAYVDLLRPSITGNQGPRLAKLQAEGPRLVLPKEVKISHYHERSSYFWKALASERIAEMPLERDYARAYRYLSKAKETGCPVATNNLAVCLELGLGTPVDTAKARQYYLEASASETESKFNVGRCHEFGIGGAADIDQAVAAYTAAKDLSAAKLGLLRIKTSKPVGTPPLRPPLDLSEVESILMNGSEPLRYAASLALESTATSPAYRLACILILCGGDLAAAESEYASLFSHASRAEKLAAQDSAEYFFSNVRFFTRFHHSYSSAAELTKLFGLSPEGETGSGLRKFSLSSPRGMIIASWGDGFSVEQLLMDAQLNFKACGEDISVESLRMAWDALGGVKRNSEAWLNSIDHRWKNPIGFNNAKAIATAAHRNAEWREQNDHIQESIRRLRENSHFDVGQFKMNEILRLESRLKSLEADPPLPEAGDTLLARLMREPLDSTRLFMLFCLMRSVKDVTTRYANWGSGNDEPEEHDSAYYELQRKLLETPDTPQELTDGSIKAYIRRSQNPAIHESTDTVMTLLAHGYHYERNYARIG